MRSAHEGQVLGVVQGNYQLAAWFCGLAFA
jgi:hypothetical protein